MFGFQKLDVYRCAIEFLSLAAPLSESVPKGYAALGDQLRRASSSIPLNLAEGTGRMTSADKKHYITIARSSVFECVAILQVLGELGSLPLAQAQDLYDRYEKVSKMLLGMYRSHSE